MVLGGQGFSILYFKMANEEENRNHKTIPWKTMLSSCICLSNLCMLLLYGFFENKFGDFHVHHAYDDT